jgi:hypothetical protein
MERRRVEVELVLLLHSAVGRPPPREVFFFFRANPREVLYPLLEAFSLLGQRLVPFFSFYFFLCCFSGIDGDLNIVLKIIIFKIEDIQNQTTLEFVPILNMIFFQMWRKFEFVQIRIWTKFKYEQFFNQNIFQIGTNFESEQKSTHYRKANLSKNQNKKQMENWKNQKPSWTIRKPKTRRRKRTY